MCQTKAEIEQHKAVIYDSIIPKDPSRFLRRKKNDGII